MISDQYIPDDWDIEDLGEVVEILDKHREPVNSEERQKRTEGLDEGELYPYYGAGGQSGWIDDYIFNEELVLLGEDGYSTGYTYMIDGKSWVNNHTHVLKGEENKIKNIFLHYYLRTVDYSEFSTGSTRPKLTQTNMKKIPVPIPPLEQQEQIIENISTKFTVVDDLNDSIESLELNVKSLFASFLAYTYSGQNNLNSSGVSGIPELQDLPNHWDIEPLGNVAEINPRIDYSKERDQFPHVPMDGVSAENQEIEYFEERDSIYSGLSKFNEGDILFARITPCMENGKVALVDKLPEDEEMSFGSTEFAVVRAGDRLVNEYVFYYLASSMVRNEAETKMTGGTGRKRVPLRYLREELRIPIPPKNIQHEIIDRMYVFTPRNRRTAQRSEIVQIHRSAA